MEIKNVFDRLISRLDTTEERIRVRLKVDQQKLHNLKCKKKKKRNGGKKKKKYI